MGLFGGKLKDAFNDVIGVVGNTVSTVIGSVVGPVTSTVSGIVGSVGSSGILNSGAAVAAVQGFTGGGISGMLGKLDGMGSNNSTAIVKDGYTGGGYTGDWNAPQKFFGKLFNYYKVNPDGLTYVNENGNRVLNYMKIVVHVVVVLTLGFFGWKLLKKGGR